MANQTFRQYAVEHMTPDEMDAVTEMLGDLDDVDDEELAGALIDLRDDVAQMQIEADHEDDDEDEDEIDESYSGLGLV